MVVFLQILFVILGWTCWLWPILFIVFLFKCIKNIVNREDLAPQNVFLCTISLICMAAAPFLSAFAIIHSH